MTEHEHVIYIFHVLGPLIKVYICNHEKRDLRFRLIMAAPTLQLSIVVGRNGVLDAGRGAKPTTES